MDFRAKERTLENGAKKRGPAQDSMLRVGVVS